jgi:hypothetical protein
VRTIFEVGPIDYGHHLKTMAAYSSAQHICKHLENGAFEKNINIDEMIMKFAKRQLSYFSTSMYYT